MSTVELFRVIGVIIQYVLWVTGAFFIITGVIAFVLARTNQNSPAQDEASLKIAAGIAVVALGTFMPELISLIFPRQEINLSIINFINYLL